jgi:hypothetical protein
MFIKIDHRAIQLIDWKHLLYLLELLNDTSKEEKKDSIIMKKIDLLSPVYSVLIDKDNQFVAMQYEEYLHHKNSHYSYRFQLNYSNRNLRAK